MCPYVGPKTLIFCSIWESIEVFHGNSYIGTWCLEYLLVSDHVEGVNKVIWDQLPLFLICSLLSTVGVALFALLPLLVGFPVDDWFVVANIEDLVSTSWWKIWKAGETRGVVW
jgi:hypothetical protein